MTGEIPLGKVGINNLTPGMILGADVRDRSGRLLLGSGTELADRHIYVLRTWGVIEVEIAGADDDSAGTNFSNAIDPEKWEAIASEITPLFHYTDQNHPAVKELMRMRILREATHGSL